MKQNIIRVIFAIDMLNEGWDVLNLYDIVRLYDTRDATGNTTMQETQLIGRGARYMPFNISTPGITISKKPAGMRKFDDDITNRLRVIEKLHYHSAHNPKYVSELKNALIKTGIIAEKIKKTLKIIIMKKLMLLLVVLLAVSCSGTKDSDYLFEDVIDCDYHFDAELKPLKEDSFKVISVTYGYIGAIVKGKKEYYYIGMYNEGFYDGMTIKKPDGEEFVIVGTYKYKTPQSGVKTIKIIETCPADIFK